MQCEKRSQHQNGMMKGGQRDGKWVEEKDEKESSEKILVYVENLIGVCMYSCCRKG